jgi:cytochrome c peroxidase
MTKRIFLLGFLILPLIGFLAGIFLGIATISQEESRPVIGNVGTFEAAYARWKAEAERKGQRTKLFLTLVHFKGLSSEMSEARGQALLDLTDGSLRVEVAGLPEAQNFDIWLVHNRPGPGRSVKPEAGDRMVRAGTLARQGDRAVLATRLDRDALTDFKLDLMVVTPSGRNPAEAGLLFASPNVFQKIYYSERSADRLIFTKLSDTDNGSAGARAILAPFGALVPTLAHADAGGIPNLTSLLVRGERLFFEETFNGNGRTCATCHPAENNFTIDPAFIATLPANHPLFVAEFNDDLNAARNGGRRFENPELMRQFGLILENVDGFDDLANKFVMRGTPHTFAQALSIEPAPANPFIPGSTLPFDGTSGTHRTGWSGDGAPGEASLREFAIGAVRQHFTRTLSRNPGVDFRLPNDAELDAIEAFMLSLGRRSELDLTALRTKLRDADVSAGLAFFNDGTVGKCAFCHFNAGASQGIFAPLGKGNANFNTGVEARAANLGLLGALRPVDGGFGKVGTLAGGFGNGTFNTPPLVEAADKKAFFHNNLCTGIECAVQFYTTAEFNDSPSGLLLRSLPPFQPVSLGQVEIFSIAAFLRAINALENIRAATEKLESARALNDVQGRRLSHSEKIFKLALADMNDAYRVLNEGRDSQFKPNGLHPAARTLLEYAKDNCALVESSRSTAERKYRIAEALNALAAAKREIVNP